MTRTLKQKLAKVRLFLCDVDGVLTDGTVHMGGGIELKAFHVMDGLGLRFLQRYGLKVGWVSRRPSPATTQRAEDIRIDYLLQIDGSKVEAVEDLLSAEGYQWGEVCYVGDDLVDLGVLRRAGVAVAVPNGARETRTLADYVTRQRGGKGAVREVVDLILKAQGHWAALVKEQRA